ncbi:hypothetical protein Q2T94_07685 [Paeniglutamicibacter sulfureus]|uniref:hypothetical protein n=1 Tax=Paeniglutamicibacter sulfureus TaxID=43666 RepID=UPI0026655425|nr:hypothetical protein [Paeniglutamicibacter sulfureus]MDO2934176.1 hypothetical protein [Paeniglutamicibacter sulfureus]
MGKTVSLGQMDVERWLHLVAPGIGVTALSLRAGFSRVRIFQQLSGDRVVEETILRVSRVLGLDPMEQLRSFPGYEYLVPSRPDPRELPAYIRWDHLMRGCAAIELLEPLSEAALGPTHFPGVSGQWVESVDPDGGLRKHLKNAGPISDPGISKMLQGRLRLDLGLLAAQYADLPRTSAYVVAQLLTPAEAGWVADERVQWLQGLGKAERLQLLERRVHAAWVREKRNRDPGKQG